MIAFASTEANRKKHLCGSRRLLIDRRQLIVRTLCHCDILPRTSNLPNHQKSEKHKRRTPLQGQTRINPLNAELNPFCHLLALLGAHPILHVSRIKVNVRKTPRQDMDKVKAVELQTAVSMTCHCVISTVDHLSEIMKNQRNTSGELHYKARHELTL